MFKIIICFCLVFPFAFTFTDDAITYQPVNLNPHEKAILKETLDPLHERYNDKEKMITKKLSGYNYHTDADTGTFHEVRTSFNYAVGLLDLGDEQYKQRAFDIIRKTIALQDTVTSSKTCGIWPYYLEEPLATKKSPPDFNWADFNSVALLDVYMGHQAKLPEDLKSTIRSSLIYAARSVQKRNVQPGYTNIAIMGTYVTFMVAHLFDLPEMKTYARNRLNHFYEYTLQRGFTEYNSPTYTVVALDELNRMRRHIIDKDSKPKIDALYNTAWEIVAKHYHKPSGQWAGPHSRSYSSLLQSTVKGLFKQASSGKIQLPGAIPRSDVKIKHVIPSQLLPYFLTPKYPRLQQYVLSIDSPRIHGTTYLTNTYALSSVNRSSLWNQRRPFLVYWGTPAKPHYLQVRFLHDLYDFSSASMYSVQGENNVLAAINFITNGGDKHISIDRLKDGKFKASDLRLRFEFGNATPEQLTVPKQYADAFSLTIDKLTVNLQLFMASFGDYKGRWEKGGNENAAWIDYVVFSGEEREINLAALDKAVLAFTCSVQDGGSGLNSTPAPSIEINEGNMVTRWKGLQLTVPVKPGLQPRNL